MLWKRTFVQPTFEPPGRNKPDSTIVLFSILHCTMSDCTGGLKCLVVQVFCSVVCFSNVCCTKIRLYKCPFFNCLYNCSIAHVYVISNDRCTRVHCTNAAVQLSFAQMAIVHKTSSNWKSLSICLVMTWLSTGSRSIHNPLMTMVFGVTWGPGYNNFLVKIYVS